MSDSSPEAISRLKQDPLFDSGHSALVFAFRFSDQCYDRPLMNRLAAPALGSGKGLVGLDGAAQAGMIRAEVQALGKLAEAIIVARIAPRSVPCHCRSACCSGKRPNREWTDAISYLADYVRTTALAGCVSNGILRREYVARYFSAHGSRDSLDDVARKHGVSRQTVSAHAGKVARDLRRLEHMAQSAVDDRLIAAGIVAS